MAWDQGPEGVDTPATADGYENTKGTPTPEGKRRPFSSRNEHVRPVMKHDVPVNMFAAVWNV